MSTPSFEVPVIGKVLYYFPLSSLLQAVKRKEYNIDCPHWLDAKFLMSVDLKYTPMGPSVAVKKKKGESLLHLWKRAENCVTVVNPAISVSTLVLLINFTILIGLPEHIGTNFCACCPEGAAFGQKTSGAL